MKNNLTIDEILKKSVHDIHITEYGVIKCEEFHELATIKRIPEVIHFMERPLRCKKWKIWNQCK